MTKYDTTGPVRINESASVCYFLALLGMVGTGIWLGLELRDLPNQHQVVRVEAVAPLTTVPAAASAPAPVVRPDDVVEGVNRMSDGTTIVKAGDTVVIITQSERNVWSVRTYPRDNPDAAERWQFASVANAIAREPNVATRFEAGNVAEKLRGLYLRPPRLTPSQVNQLRDLYLAAADASEEDEGKADQALHDAVAGMPIPPEEQRAFDNTIDAARALFTPHQLELIRTGGRTEQPRRLATRSAAPRAGRGAPTTTTHPLFGPGTGIRGH